MYHKMYQPALRIVHRGALKLVFGAVLLIPWMGRAQSLEGPEKVYVHLDRTFFAAGETIWLKGYVENALPAADTSRFLYEIGRASCRERVLW